MRSLLAAVYPPISESADLASRMIRINHAGEYGAINIYRAQILVGRLTNADWVEQLEEFIAHEKEHLALFARLLETRRIAPSRMLRLFGAAGFLLGFLCALFGRQGVMVCTAAVESVVLKHLQEQSEYLAGRDPEACSVVQSIVADEEAHQAVGETSSSLLYAPLRHAVSGATVFAIWLGIRI